MMKIILQIALVLLARSTNLVAGETAKVITLKELGTQISQKIGVAGISADHGSLLQGKIAAEARIFGDTGLELESELKNKERDGSYTAVLNQPIRLGASQVQQVLELEAKISKYEIDSMIRIATQQAAELILELTRMQARQAELEKVSGFYAELSNRLKTSVQSGQSSTLVSQQISELLRQTQEDIKINFAMIADLKDAIQLWGIDANSVSTLEVPASDGSPLDPTMATVPEVARFNAEASAAAVRAINASSQFEFNVGLGAQKSQGDGLVSYLVKLEAPIGQVFSNRQNAKVHLQEKSIHEGKARVEVALARQKVSGILSRLKKANAEKNSLIDKNKGTASIFAVAKSGYERGALSFIELRDGFDQMVGARFEMIELTKIIQNLQLELYLFTGGAT